MVEMDEETIENGTFIAADRVPNVQGPAARVLIGGHIQYKSIITSSVLRI